MEIYQNLRDIAKALLRDKSQPQETRDKSQEESIDIFL